MQTMIKKFLPHFTPPLLRLIFLNYLNSKNFMLAIFFSTPIGVEKKEGAAIPT
jgi:hypothetical protein